MLLQALKFNPQAAALVRQSLQGGFPEKFANLTQLKHLAIHRAGASLPVLPDSVIHPPHPAFGVAGQLHTEYNMQASWGTCRSRSAR